MNLVVPMAGVGRRFKDAGYSTYKPFIEIHGKPMVQYVLDAFPRDVRKFCIVDPTLLCKKEEQYLSSQENVFLCEIESHSNGPAYSLFRGLQQLPVRESFFVSYCDIFWTWDYEEVKAHLGLDGLVFTHRGFHPHLVGNNYSAFCRFDGSRPNRLAEIREKGSFTDQWMEEPLSIGAFYFKSGFEMGSLLEGLIASKKRVAGEFFPSLLFNGLVEKGAQVGLFDIDFFIHWGLPAQLNDYLYWSSLIKKNMEPKTSTSRRGIWCMGGLGARMKEVSEEPKALIDVCGKPMYQFVLDQFDCSQNDAITTEALVQPLRARGCFNEVVSVGIQTRSQVETLEKAVPYLREARDFLLLSCDAFGLFDPRALDECKRVEQPDAIVFTFEPSLLNKKSPGHHTFVSAVEDKVTSVHIKSSSCSLDKGLAGFFWFKDGKIFEDLKKTPQDKQHEMCIDHFMKYLVASGKKVMAIKLDGYVHLGTPNEYNEFQFWLKHLDPLAFKSLRGSGWVNRWELADARVKSSAPLQ